MDARLDLFALLGLDIGDAHIIRNAGGIVTDDVVRSLLISQRLLGTTDVVVIQHTQCGLLRLDADALADELEAETGRRPSFPLGSFDDLEASVRTSVASSETNGSCATGDRCGGSSTRSRPATSVRCGDRNGGSSSTSGISRSVLSW